MDIRIYVNWYFVLLQKKKLESTIRQSFGRKMLDPMNRRIKYNQIQIVYVYKHLCDRHQLTNYGDILILKFDGIIRFF